MPNYPLPLHIPQQVQKSSKHQPISSPPQATSIIRTAPSIYAYPCAPTLLKPDPPHFASSQPNPQHRLRLLIPQHQPSTPTIPPHPSPPLTPTQHQPYPTFSPYLPFPHTHHPQIPHSSRRTDLPNVAEPSVYIYISDISTPVKLMDVSCVLERDGREEGIERMGLYHFPHLSQ